jgi:hypothetical protein
LLDGHEVNLVAVSFFPSSMNLSQVAAESDTLVSFSGRHISDGNVNRGEPT